MEIKCIILGGFAANCYLIKSDSSFILIDTGRPSKKMLLEKEFENTGCKPGNLKLVILTHGDFDHTGNCAYLRSKYHAPIAMHKDDIGMVEQGNMFWNRKTGNFILKKLVNVLFGITKFSPDFAVEDGFELMKYGLDAKVVYIPGHSKGSIGILTGEGDFFCGDLFSNIKNPCLNSIIDDVIEANSSFEKLKTLNIKTVYPGHGKPFQMGEIQ